MRISIPIGLILIALAFGYFLKPSLDAQQKAADAWIEKAQNDAAAKLNLGDLLNAGVAGTLKSGLYEDDIFFSRYTVTIGDKPFLHCFGIFSQINCSKIDG